jgi:hypothetical protein
MAHKKKSKYQRGEGDNTHIREQVELQGYWQSHDIVLFSSNLSKKKNFLPFTFFIIIKAGQSRMSLTKCPRLFVLEKKVLRINVPEKWSSERIWMGVDADIDVRHCPLNHYPNTITQTVIHTLTHTNEILQVWEVSHSNFSG